jgi:hypothetical protein
MSICKRGGKIAMTWGFREAAKNPTGQLLLVSAGAFALFTQTGALSLRAQSVPGTWKVIPGIETNAVFLPVGQDIAVVSANDIWQVGYATTGHWDGSAWSIVPAPNGSTNPNGKTASQLVSVAAVS